MEGPSPEGRALLRREMELHLKGFSLECIRERCLAEGLVPAKHRRTFTGKLIDDHLKSPFYAGLPVPEIDARNPNEVYKSRFVWRGVEYRGKHEPIFSADEWERLKASFGLKSKYRKLKHKGLFSQGPLSLTCAECHCKVTYAPKTKANGTTYHYYRCADGKRVHRDGHVPQVNVKEHQILDQLMTAVDAITITPDLADDIAKALNATHESAVTAKRALADQYRIEIKYLDEREDRLFDRYDNSEIDRDTYDRQRERLRREKAERFELLRASESDVDRGYLHTAQTVLELAKQAKSKVETRSREEKLALLSRVVCNPQLEGRTVRYELQKPFAVLAQMNENGEWRPRRDSNPC